MNQLNLPSGRKSADRSREHHEDVGVGVGVRPDEAQGSPEPSKPWLYRAGQDHAARVGQRPAGGTTGDAVRLIAAEHSTSTKSVRDAMAFAAAVDHIAANCDGPATRDFLLTDHPRLSVRDIMRMFRTHPDRQRFAVLRALEGRDPFGKPPPGIEPPFDTLGYDEVLSRLRRNAGLLDHVADGLIATRPELWPDDRVLRRVRNDLKQILAVCGTLGKWMRATGARPRTVVPDLCWPGRVAPAAFNPTTTRWKVGSVRGVTEKNLRDLPRLLGEKPPTSAEKDEVLAGVRRLRGTADRLKAVIEEQWHDLRAGPSKVPGTYVVFYFLPESVRGLRIGDLGHFDFPTGYYAYVGSAFGGGGVRSRTGRHLTKWSQEEWNIDYLKPLCVPVEVWWTQDRVKVEFYWAGLLAEIPGASFPAPGFGAADNPSAEAHLARFDALPSVALFRRLVAQALPGHATVFSKVIEAWAGDGWPGA